MSERPAWDRLAANTPLERLIGALNFRLVRWADLIARLQRKNVRAVATDAVLSSNDDWLLVDTTAAGRTVSTLAPASAFTGKEFVIKRSAGGNNITFDPAGAETIDGAGSATLNGNVIVSDGSNWWSV